MLTCIPYLNFTGFVSASADLKTVNSHNDLLDAGSLAVSSASVPLVDGEGLQAMQVAAGPRVDVPAGALELEAVSVEGAVVGVTPGPAGTRRHGKTHRMAVFDDAFLLRGAWSRCTGICKNNISYLETLE